MVLLGLPFQNSLSPEVLGIHVSENNRISATGMLPILLILQLLLNIYVVPCTGLYTEYCALSKLLSLKQTNGILTVEELSIHL